MDNKKFIIIYVILIVIILGMVVFSAVKTAIKSEESKKINISIDEFNDIILQSNNFNSSRVKKISDEELKEMFDISNDEINIFYGKKSVLNTDASIYLLIEAKDNTDDILEKINSFGEKYELKWSEYLESEYDIVKDRKIGIINNFIYCIISDDADDIIRDVENSNI